MRNVSGKKIVAALLVCFSLGRAEALPTGFDLPELDSGYLGPQCLNCVADSIYSQAILQNWMSQAQNDVRFLPNPTQPIEFQPIEFEPAGLGVFEQAFNQFRSEFDLLNDRFQEDATLESVFQARSAQ